MEIYAQNVSLSNSIFRGFTFSSAGGALNLVLETLSIEECSFEEHNGLNSDSSGVLKIEDGNPEENKVISGSIQNSTFTGNAAPYGTVISAEDLSIQIIIHNSSFVDNHATAFGGVFSFSRTSSSSILITQTNITQTNNNSTVFYPQYSAFAVNESEESIQISNSTRLTAIGQVVGNFIETKGVSKTVTTFGNDFMYTAKIASDVTSNAVLKP